VSSYKNTLNHLEQTSSFAIDFETIQTGDRVPLYPAGLFCAGSSEIPWLLNESEARRFYNDSPYSHDLN
jgi:hypothetical protein